MPTIDLKDHKEETIQYYLKRIIEEFAPNRVFITGSAVNEGMPITSDFDFIVDSDQPLDADAILGNLDIIPFKYATKEMLNKAKIIYSNNQIDNE